MFPSQIENCFINAFCQASAAYKQRAIKDSCFGCRFEEESAHFTGGNQDERDQLREVYERLLEITPRERIIDFLVCEIQRQSGTVIDSLQLFLKNDPIQKLHFCRRWKAAIIDSLTKKEEGSDCDDSGILILFHCPTPNPKVLFRTAQTYKLWVYSLYSYLRPKCRFVYFCLEYCPIIWRGER